MNKVNISIQSIVGENRFLEQKGENEAVSYFTQINWKAEVLRFKKMSTSTLEFVFNDAKPALFYLLNLNENYALGFWAIDDDQFGLTYYDPNQFISKYQYPISTKDVIQLIRLFCRSDYEGVQFHFTEILKQEHALGSNWIQMTRNDRFHDLLSKSTKIILYVSVAIYMISMLLFYFFNIFL